MGKNLCIYLTGNKPRESRAPFVEAMEVLCATKRERGSLDYRMQVTVRRVDLAVFSASAYNPAIGPRSRPPPAARCCFSQLGQR
jgi:hypothetical protein